MLGQTKTYLSKKKVTIDVGAAVGMYTHFFAQNSGYVFSYEPVMPIFEQLLKVEKIHNNVIAINKAVSNFKGLSSFYVDDTRLSNNSFKNLVGGQKINVKTTFIDEENHGIVGFIKVDVEGYELDVLKGAKNTIEEFSPACMVEIYPGFNNDPLEHTFEFFFERQYECYYNQNGLGLVKVDNLKQGIIIANDEEMIKIHDGDFLFVKN
jgi:FkbM family methyltransferase